MSHEGCCLCEDWVGNKCLSSAPRGNGPTCKAWTSICPLPKDPAKWEWYYDGHTSIAVSGSWQVSVEFLDCAFVAVRWLVIRGSLLLAVGTCETISEGKQMSVDAARKEWRKPWCHCKGCGEEIQSCKDYCQACQSARREFREYVEGIGWTMGSGPTLGWVFDRRGKPMGFIDGDGCPDCRANRGTKT